MIRTRYGCIAGRCPSIWGQATQTISGNVPRTFDTPSSGNYVDISALSFCDTETSLIPGQHIDVGFPVHSKKRELIFHILPRLERMRDNTLCYNGGGGEEDRLWALGKLLRL